MPQLQLPVFPAGVTPITADLGFRREGDKVYYFYGTMPVAHHHVDDIRSFKMFVAQFCDHGKAQQMDIVRAFGVTDTSVKRWVKAYREKGPAAFFEPRRTRGPAVLTPPVMEAAQELLDEGLSRREVAERLGLKKDTLSKAVLAGHLRERKKKQ